MLPDAGANLARDEWMISHDGPIRFPVTAPPISEARPPLNSKSNSQGTLLRRQLVVRDTGGTGMEDVSVDFQGFKARLGDLSH
jgi:hypothetical protein